MSERLLARLLAAVAGIDTLAILTHNNPDPDAIASAVALQHLLAEQAQVESIIYYKGIVGRAENRALLRYLGHPLKYLINSELYLANPVALVDTQPEAGNNALPDDVSPLIVIDHHPHRQASSGAAFIDIRPDVGSVSTMMIEYLRAADAPLSTQLATALFYGIKTDTMGLERGTGPIDRDAFCHLLPLVDIEALFKIEQAQVPAQYFINFSAALQRVRIFDDLVVSYIGLMNYPDLAAEMADFLLRMEGVQWVLCLGVYKEYLYLSVRSRRQTGAGDIIQHIVAKQGLAGGHGAMAGGQVRLKEQQDPEQLAETFIQRAVEQLGLEASMPGQPLM